MAAPRATARRTVWTIADQGMSSLSNFALGVVIARQVSFNGFAAFALAISVYNLVRGACAAVVSEPLLLRNSGQLARDRRNDADALGVYGLISALLAIITVTAGVLAPSDVGPSLIAVGACLTPLLVQDCCRFVLFAQARPQSALLNDAVWIVVQLVLITSLMVAGSHVTWMYVMAWSGGSLVAAVFGLRQVGFSPEGVSPARWWNRQRDIVGRYLVEYLVGAGLPPLILVSAGGLVGVATIGAYRAIQVLFGPVRVLLLSVVAAAVPEGVRTLERRGSLPKLSAAFAGLVAGGALAVGVVLWRLPDHLGHAVLGDSWPEAHPLALIVAVGIAAAGIETSSAMGLRVLGASAASFRYRVLCAPLTLSAALIGGWWLGARGLAAGLATGAAVNALVSIRGFRHHHGRYEHPEPVRQEELLATGSTLSP
jgi:O-antigen/teichoic acid export membrane protein